MDGCTIEVCPRIGSHWEAVTETTEVEVLLIHSLSAADVQVLGFQGTDPHTDLNRSGGLLNARFPFVTLSTALLSGFLQMHSLKIP